jgi:hypothetical protein
MARTTLNIDAPLLQELKKLQKRDGRPLGRIVSDLLAAGLSGGEPPTRREPFRWRSRRMEALVDLEDREAVYALIDETGRIDEVAGGD